MTSRPKKNVIKINDIIMYLAVLLKHARLIVLLCCFSIVTGIFYYNFSRPIYHSKSLVYYRVIERPSASVDAEKVFHDSRDGTVLRELGSSHVIKRVAKRLGVDLSYNDIVKFYVRKLQIRLNSEKNIEIDVWSYSPQWAEECGRIMLEEYLLAREQRRLEQSRLIIDAFNKELVEMRNRMDEVFDAKFDFRDTNELTAILIELNQLKAVPKELYMIKYQISVMDDVRKALERQTDPIAKLSLLASTERKGEFSLGQVIPAEDMAGEGSDKKDNPIIVMPQVASAARPWESLEKERRRVQAEIHELGEKFLPGHPQMAKLQKQMELANHSLDLEFQVALHNFDVEYATLLEKKQAFENKLPAYDDITRRHARFTQKFNTFGLSQLGWARMQAETEKRLEAIDYGSDKERGYLQFSSVDVDNEPVSPNRFRLAIYSMILSIALSIAVPFLIEYLDNRVSDVEEVEDVLRIRGLGVVPKVTDPDGSGLFLFGDAKPDYHLQENFRVIRTNLVVNSDAATLPQVILITSAMPREGKTVISSNLAMSFAMKGEKTLLVDCDLRRGRLHRIFGTHNKPGLSDVLREQKPVEDGIRTTPHDNLHLMTCGKHLNSASELLDSASFVKVMEELRQKYQRIIVDTPPVLGLAETSIIQRLADGILFVIWGEFTPIRNVKAAIQSLQGNGAKFCGFVLNRLDFHTLGNRYKYFYYAPSYYTNYKAIDVPASYAEK